MEKKQSDKDQESNNEKPLSDSKRELLKIRHLFVNKKKQDFDQN